MTVFRTTNWDLVDGLVSSSDKQRDAALSELCQLNWKPVYSFLRARGYPVNEADDLTQGFFYYLIDKELMSRADRKKGKFRSFIIGTLKKYCSDQHAKATAQKRNPSQRLIEIDDLEAIEESLIPDIGKDPQKLFMREWANNILQRVMAHLKSESEALGKAHFYDLVQKVYFEVGDKKSSYSSLAERHGMTLDQIGNALRAAKQLYGSLLRTEVGKTVETSEEIDDEIREIMLVLQEKK